MRKSSKRVVFWTMLAAGALVVALAGAVGASARDGHGRDDGARAAEARGHDQENEAARQEDRGQDEVGDDEAAAAGKPIFVSSLAPSIPSDPAIHGVAAGGLPWVLDEGSVRLRADGRIHVEVEGLVIPVAHGTFPAGTARPVTTVSASLYCAPDGSAAVATTDSAPISEAGDAEIEDTIAVPATCLAPVVLVHPNGNGGAYIAVTGTRP